MKTEPSGVMSLDDSHSSSPSPTSDSLPPSVTHVSRDELRKFLKCKRVGNYLLGKTIGEGSFAKVKQGFHVLTGEKVAVKIIDKKQAMEDRYVSKNMRREAKILQMVHHPNVIQLLEVVETENRYYLAFEVAGGGDLMDYICYRKKLGEVEVRKFMRQIISAVYYLHQGGIIHRDLKVENLLLDDSYNIKIIDFGLSNTINVPTSGERSSTRDHCKTQCGSPAYAAPEILGHLTYGTKVDVWSIGVNMYAMLTGKLPYTAEPFNIITLYNKMVKGDMNPVPDRLSAGCKDLMLKFLTFDPTERISIEEAICHPWLSKGFDEPVLQLQFPSYIRPDQLNNDIVNHMCDKMQFKTKDIIEGVTNNKSNAASCVYHLINRKLQRYLDKHPNHTRMLRRAKSRDDETDAIPKKQRIDIDTDSSLLRLETSRSITSQQLRSGANSSQGSRGIRIGTGSGASSQGSRGPRGRLASDRDGTELKGSAVVPNASDHYLAVPKGDVQTSGAFNQLSIDIEDEDLDGIVEGYDPVNRKISIPYDYQSERKHSRADYYPSPLTIREHQPTTLIIDDNNNDDNVDGVADDVFVKNNEVKDGDVTEAKDAGKDGEGSSDKDVGMAPTIGETVVKVVSLPVSSQLETLMGPADSAQQRRKTSLPSPSPTPLDNTENQPVTRSRRASLPSRTYPVTRDPSPVRKPSQPSEPVTSPPAIDPKGVYGLVCQVTAVNPNEITNVTEPAQLMLRSTLSPLSVHCSPKPSRRHSTPVNPTQEFYEEVLGLNKQTSPRESPEAQPSSQENANGAKSLSKPFGSPGRASRQSTSSTSSDDRSTSSNRTRVLLPVTPREPLLPNLGLKLMTKHPPIEPISLAPLTTRKLSLDSKTRNEKTKERRRRRNTIMNPPLHGRHDIVESHNLNKQSRDEDLRDVTRESRKISNESRDQSVDFDTHLVNGTSSLDKDTLEVPRDESRDSDSSNSSIGNYSGSSKVRARVTIKERRQTTELDMRAIRQAQVRCKVSSDDVTRDKVAESRDQLREKESESREKLHDKASESRDELRDIIWEPRDKTKHSCNGKVKPRVTIKERRQTTELDTRAVRNTNRIQFKITDTHEPRITIPQSRDIPKKMTRVEELKTAERRVSVPEKSREQYHEQNGSLVRGSSVPVLNQDNKPNKMNYLDTTRHRQGLIRTMSDTNTKELERLAGKEYYDDNPWRKHEKTIQRSIAMRAEMANKRAEGGKKSKPSLERARRHTVSTSSPITTTTKHKVVSSPRTLKKSLV